MKYLSGIVYLISLSGSAQALRPSFVSRAKAPSTVLKGYLDDLSGPVQPQQPPQPPQPNYNSANTENSVDRYGPGDWKEYVDFNEFDGGDGKCFMREEFNISLSLTF